MDPADHLLYVLLDSNLPTGGFIASSGLESWAKHGFLHHDSATQPATGQRGREGEGESSSAPSGSRAPRSNRQAGQAGAAVGVTEFARAEVENYVKTTGGFVRDAWEVVDGANREREGEMDNGYRGRNKGMVEKEQRDVSSSPLQSSSSLDGVDPTRSSIDHTLARLIRLDKTHDACLLSHVSRRASTAQGVAMLTLYTKGLSPPGGWSMISGSASEQSTSPRLIEAYKLAIRKGDSPGHLAICWGAMTAALGIDIDRALHLHLFLHARSLLSAAVRLNLIGPYLSSQLLLHPFKEIIDDCVARFDGINGNGSTDSTDSTDSTKSTDNTEKSQSSQSISVNPDEPPSNRETHASVGTPFPAGIASHHLLTNGHHLHNATYALPPSSINTNPTALLKDVWAWTSHAERGPATTWPLGEVLVGRHDLQHSRIFNS